MLERPFLDKPYSDACEENKEPILAVIAPLFSAARQVLEVGSGTGQHAVWFAAHLPHLQWQTSDVCANLPGIRLWVEEAQLPNLPPPLSLDVAGDWPAGPVDGVFSANTLHIMRKTEVERLFRGVARVLAPGAPFALYGPFRYGRRHTSESNARFDAWLKARDPRLGVRDLEDLRPLAHAQGLDLVADHSMPVNNRTLVWQKQS